ncbi:MAG: sigma-70 family RNA polymerase sigma factor [Planctomycetota bacterium]
MESPDQSPPEPAPAPYGGRDPSRALSLAALGEFDDFGALYEALAPSLFAWARLRTGAMALDPDDLLQEVWIRALQSGASFDPARGSFRAWVFGIAKHVYLEALRKRPVRRDASQASAALNAWPEIVTSIRSRMARDESVKKLVEHVEAIDELDRKIFIHCGLEDMPCTLAAVRLGLSAEAVTKRWQRLRAKLRSDGVAEHLLL